MMTIERRLSRLEEGIAGQKQAYKEYCTCPEGGVIVIESVSMDGTKRTPTEKQIEDARQSITRSKGEKCPVCGKLCKKEKITGFTSVLPAGIP